METKILEFLRDWFKTHAIKPTTEQLRLGTGAKTEDQVFAAIWKLRSKGLIEKGRGNLRPTSEP